MTAGTATTNYGFDHINRNAPVLIRTPKLTRFEPAQYWGGGPPGNSVVLNPFLPFFWNMVLWFSWESDSTPVETRVRFGLST